MSLPTTPPRVMRGSNGSVAGASGYPPIPAAADNVKYLKGDGTWSALSNASAATNAEASAGTSTTTFVTPANAGLAVAGARNALAPRGGVAFDGTAGGKGLAALTNQSIGTDAFSVSLVFSAPAYAGTTKMLARLSGVSNGSGGAGSALTIYVDTALTFHFRNAAHDGYIQASVDFTPYYGKTVHVVGVRSGATFAIYVNGTSIAFTPPSGGAPVLFSQNLVTTYFEIGGYITTSVPVSAIYSASLYNLALTAAEVLEIYELGGAMRERHKYGSQVARYTSDFSAGLDGFNAAGGGYATLTCSGNVDTSADGASIPPSDNWQRADQSGTGRITFYSNASAGLAVYQKTVRISGSIFTPSGSTVTHMVVGFEVLNTTNEGYINSGGLGFIAGSVVALTPGSTTNFDVTAINTVPGSTRAIYIVASNSAGVAQNYTAQKVYLKDVVVRQAGAVCHLGLADGIGRIARDSSTNKLHAIRTATGVSDVIELDDGIYPQLALTANGELLDTAGVLRTDAVLVDVIVKNTTANAVTAFGLGMSSGVRNLTYETLIPANSTVVLPILRADLAGLTVGTAPYGRVYYSASSWNSGSLNISIRYRRERDL
jgi:hypothetical protein